MELEASLRKEWREANAVVKKDEKRCMLVDKQKAKYDEAEYNSTESDQGYCEIDDSNAASQPNRYHFREAPARKILAKLLNEAPAFEQVLKAELVSDARNQDNGPKIYDVRRPFLSFFNQLVPSLFSEKNEDFGMERRLQRNFS